MERGPPIEQHPLQIRQRPLQKAQNQKKHVHLTAKWRMPTRSMAQVLTVEML